MIVHRFFTTLLLSSIALVLAFCQSDNGAWEKNKKAKAWHYLFDGSDMDQWRGYNHETFPTLGWKIENGHLVVEKSDGDEEGFGGDIITKEKFGDFELELEFMLSDTANSGIFYLVEEGLESIWHAAPEYQILDNKTYNEMLGDWMPTHRTAENYDLQEAPADYLRPNGTWNKARIIKKGNHVEHWLNGQKTIEYEINSPAWKALVAKSKFKDHPRFGQVTEGHIGLQDHGHRVEFRNIRIK